MPPPPISSYMSAADQERVEAEVERLIAAKEWRPHKDEKTGRAYYGHRVTKQVVWNLHAHVGQVAFGIAPPAKVPSMGRTEPGSSNGGTPSGPSSPASPHAGTARGGVLAPPPSKLPPPPPVKAPPPPPSRSPPVARTPPVASASPASASPPLPKSIPPPPLPKNVAPPPPSKAPPPPPLSGSLAASLPLPEADSPSSLPTTPSAAMSPAAAAATTTTTNNNARGVPPESPRMRLLPDGRMPVKALAEQLSRPSTPEEQPLSSSLGRKPSSATLAAAGSNALAKNYLGGAKKEFKRPPPPPAKAPPPPPAAAATSPPPAALPSPALRPGPGSGGSRPLSPRVSPSTMAVTDSPAAPPAAAAAVASCPPARRNPTPPRVMVSVETPPPPPSTSSPGHPGVDPQRTRAPETVIGRQLRRQTLSPVKTNRSSPAGRRTATPQRDRASPNTSSHVSAAADSNAPAPTIPDPSPPQPLPLFKEDPTYRHQCLKLLFERTRSGNGSAAAARAWMQHEAAMPTLLAAAGDEIPPHKLPPLPPPVPGDDSGSRRDDAWTHGCYFVTATQRPVLGCVRLTQRSAELFSWDTNSTPSASPQERQRNGADAPEPSYDLVRRVLHLASAPQHVNTLRPTSRIPTGAPPSEYADAPTVELATAVCLTMCPRTHIMTLHHHGQPVAALRGVGVGSHVPSSIPFVDPSKLLPLSAVTNAAITTTAMTKPTVFPIGDGPTDLGVAQIVSDAPNLLLEHLCEFLDARTTAAAKGRQHRGGEFAIERPSRNVIGGAMEDSALGSVSPINRAASSPAADNLSSSPVSRAQQVRDLLKRSLHPSRPEGVAEDGGWREDESSRVMDGPTSEHQRRRQREMAALDAVSRIGKPILTSPPRRQRSVVASSTVRRTSTPKAPTSVMTSRERVSARRADSLRATGRVATAANEPARNGTITSTTASSWQRHADPVLLDRAYQAALRAGYPSASDSWQVRRGHAPAASKSATTRTTRGSSSSVRRTPRATGHYVTTPQVNDGDDARSPAMASPSRVDRSLARPSRYTDRPQPMQIGRHEAARGLHVDDDVLAVLEAHSLHDMTSRFATQTRSGDSSRYQHQHQPDEDDDGDDDAAGLADLDAMNPAARRKVLEALLEANRVMDEQLDESSSAW